jgi:hypothetical protein
MVALERIPGKEVPAFQFVTAALSSPSMDTKLSRVKALMAAGDTVAALRIVASFARLGEHRERIQRGWMAHTRPDFVREIGLGDPSVLVADAVASIRERYRLNFPGNS